MSSVPHKTPATKPRPRDANATRQAILNAAQTIIARDGFSGARIDEIAKESGYNKSLIFQYFTDKAGLYRAVIERLRDSSDTAFTAAIAEHLEPNKPLNRQKIETILRASANWSFTHFLEEPEYLRLFAWEMAEGWKVFSSIPSSLEPSFQFGLELIREAQSRGLMRQEISAETIVANMMLIPFITLGSIPRFQHLYPRDQSPQALANSPKLLEKLREQIVASILVMALPDE
jgi:TetR/AcrR family transcriptional regulator